MRMTHTSYVANRDVDPTRRSTWPILSGMNGSWPFKGIPLLTNEALSTALDCEYK